MASVMIVDDAAFMRMRLKAILESAGHVVVEASNGAEAVAQYVDSHPQAVFMDITMPEMDGLEALKSIRGNDPEAKVVMCSALGQQSMVMQAIQSGAKDFIVKPFQPDRVLNALERLGA